MIYLSIAIVFTAAILARYGLTITIHRTHRLIEQPLPQEVPQKEELTEEERNRLPKEPTYDEVMKAVNDVMYELGGDDA